MSDELEIFPSTIPTPKKKKRKSVFASRKERMEAKGFTRKEINVVRAHLANPDATRVEKGKMAGLVGKDSTVASQVDRALERVKEKTSNNTRLQELLELNGAGLVKIAKVFGEAMDATQLVRVGKDSVTVHPDHRSRMEAGKFAAEVQQCLPDKKVVVETRTYEQKVQLIGVIKSDPSMLRDLQQLLEMKKREAGE